MWLLLTLLLAQGACAAGQASIDAVIASIEGGQFQSAERSIADALAQASLEPDSRKAFEFQRERMRRILLDFTLDETALKERLRK